MSKYEINLHLFSKKLSALLINRGMVDKKGNPDKIALYNALYENDKITEELCKNDRQIVTDKTRTVDNWIKGKHYPKSISDILILCNALDCDLDYFFTDMEAPTHDLEFISHKTGLTIRAINKLISYGLNVKELLSNLIDCNDFKEEHDFLHMLLLAMLNYGMSTGETKIVLKDSLFGTEEEITNAEIVSSMLKYSATQIFDLCLSCSSFALHNTKTQIHDLNLKLANAKAEQLLKELTDSTGKSEKEILAEIEQRNNHKK